MSFSEKIETAAETNDSLVCIGLDTVEAKLPEGVSDIFEFNKAIINATKDIVCAYKPNNAFYEASEEIGYRALKQTCAYIKESTNIPIILDAKRGDIGNTNEGYVKSAFDNLGADAITVHPFMGKESLQPFLDGTDKGIIILCRTSNPEADELQDLVLEDGKTKLYQYLAQNITNHWNENGNCAVVAGATNPEEIAEIRKIIGDDMLILIPGLGKQGGDAEAAVKAGANSKGRGIVLNSSRGIIYASSGADFAEAARSAAIKFRDETNSYR